MRRAEEVLARRRVLLWIVTALLLLGGAIGVVWLQGRAESARLAAEADRRGTAVSTLADDVRTLRAQVVARGGTPAAPPPERAIAGLKDRAEVPVPIPGPRGPAGPAGSPASTITPSPGATGPSGPPGQNATGAPGTPGQAGADGQDGQDGKDGAPGSPPASWSWTDRHGDTYRCSRAGGPDSAPEYGCTQTGSGPADPAPEPEPTPSDRSGLLGLAVLDRRKTA